MPTEDARKLTVGSLQGVPMGQTPERPVAPAATASDPSAIPPTETEGPNWTVTGGEAARAEHAAWRSDGIEALTYNNPFGQRMERVWFDGKVVFAVDLGEVEVDPARVKVAQEYQPCYAVDLDENGRRRADAELVEGQLNIYDTVPGMDRYSPIWQFNYVLVPRDYRVNSLRSERDCLVSGYPILKSQEFEN